MNAPSQNSAAKVCAVIPCYNGEGTVRNALDSLLAQNYPNLEIIVVNDGSTDGTAEVLASYGERIRVIDDGVNMGIAATYNRGARAADGEFLLLMACDCSLSDPDYIAKAVAHMHDESIAAVCGQGIFGDLSQLGRVQRLFTAVNMLDVVESEERVYDVAFIETRCDLVRRKALEEIGYWFEDLQNATEDQDLSARMRERGYRLIQDKTLKFQLDFGSTEDTIGKVLHKQHQYAHGQGYIFLRHGLGHHTMTGSQPNRRSRIVHRFVQILMGPLAVLGIGAALMGSPAAWSVVAAFALRAGSYWWSSRRWLSGLERVYCAGIGLACDLVYSFTFLRALVWWSMRNPSLLGLGKATTDRG